MRLWHKDLIPVLPRLQLVSQWRECCAIARNIALIGYPNHILVNKIMEYPLEDFLAYATMVRTEMTARGYQVDPYNFSKWVNDDNDYFGCLWPVQASALDMIRIDESDIFPGWHNDRYYWQCYHNLEEKYDCGAIPQDEWETICDEVCLKL